MAKHYPKEIRLTALKRYFKGKQTAAQIGRALKVPHQTISAWIGNAKDGLDSMKWTPRKIHDLCEKVKRLENMITVLKLVNCTTYSPIQEKLLLILRAKLQLQYSTVAEPQAILRVLNLPT